MKYMEGIFFSEEIDSLSNVLERDHFNRCRRKRMTPRSRRQTANETSEQTEDRDHVRRGRPRRTRPRRDQSSSDEEFV